ncbi:MAG: hypothetical protein LAT81_09890 [Oceanicaulis sp.]|nr:hypothetical protein [Oceanicaulis sp.]
MFEVRKHKSLLKNFHKVVENKKVLFNDGENDIIYTGTNEYKNRLLCFIMFEDDEKGFLRYIHILVTEKQYSDFINQQTSLRNILNENESVFIVDLDYALNEIDQNLVSINEIPVDYLPLKNSFCPDFIKESSFTYAVSLLGGLADYHKAEAHELSDVSTHFSEFLKSSTSFINDFHLENRIYVEALKAGSFKINFLIEIKEPEQLGIFENPTYKIRNFLSNYFRYFFNKLPKEENSVFKSESVDSEDFRNLEKDLQIIYEEKHVLPKGGVEQKLIDLINHSATQIENINYNGSFKELKFEQSSLNNTDIPLGVIDNSFIPSIKNKLFDVSKFRDEPIKRIDENPKKYKFQVYQFNTNTGNGSAYFTDLEDSVSKITVHARGMADYKNTSFTKSMDDGKPMIFDGIGEYINDKLKKIICKM